MLICNKSNISDNKHAYSEYLMTYKKCTDLIIEMPFSSRLPLLPTQTP